jgi:hypothetical protein
MPENDTNSEATKWNPATKNQLTDEGQKTNSSSQSDNAHDVLMDCVMENEINHENNIIPQDVLEKENILSMDVKGKKILNTPASNISSFGQKEQDFRSSDYHNEIVGQSAKDIEKMIDGSSHF